MATLPIGEAPESSKLWVVARHPRKLKQLLEERLQIAFAEGGREVKEAWEPVFSMTDGSY